jgi:hypothetical protein
MHVYVTKTQLDRCVGVVISFWLFLFSIYLFVAEPKEFFLVGLKKLDQRSRKCVEFREEYIEYIHFFNPAALFSLYSQILMSPCLTLQLNSPVWSFMVIHEAGLTYRHSGTLEGSVALV